MQYYTNAKLVLTYLETCKQGKPWLNAITEKAKKGFSFTEGKVMPCLDNSMRLRSFSTSCFQFWTDIETQLGVTDNQQEAYQIWTIYQLE